MEASPILFETTYGEELFMISPALTIIIDQPWETVSALEVILLEKILSAIKQSLHSITIKYQASLDLSGWVEKPKQVIYFGSPIKGIPLYEVVEADGVAVIASEKLSDLSKNDEARKKLWQVLKLQFSV